MFIFENKLKNIPSEICGHNLINLHSLDITKNRVKKIPHEVLLMREKCEHHD